MRTFLPLLALGLFAAIAPAYACKCTPDADGSRAAALLADPAISVVDAYVRGMNTRNGQSMLELKKLHHGGLMAQTIRAKFGSNDCAFIPQYKQTMTMLVRAENDGTYSIEGGCGAQAVLQSLGKGQ